MGDKVAFCNVVPNYKSLENTSSHCEKNTKLDTYHHNTINLNEYTCHYNLTVLAFFNRYLATLNTYTKYIQNP